MNKTNNKTDWFAFSCSSIVIIAICLPLLLNPKAGADLLPTLYSMVADTLGPLYMLAGAVLIVFLVWIALSRFGNIRFGGEQAAPEFTTLSWIGMLFCAGVGAGLMYWAAIEWAYYVQTPPFGVAEKSPEAFSWASAYGLFHWGPTAWAFYCLPTLAIAYAFHNKGVPALRLSSACSAFESCQAEKPGGRLIDLLFMISLLGGAGSSLGFTTPMIAAAFERLFGIEANFQLEVIAMLLIISLFAFSAALGIRNGIKRLTDLNVGLIFLLLIFILLAGPTAWLIKTAINATGIVIQNFVRMSTWTEPFGATNFVKDWTIFYWAWWIAYGPVVGLFVARISRGRTIRQVVFGMMGYGTLGGGLFFVILGNYGLYLEMTGAADILSLMGSDGGGSAAIIGVLNQLPMPAIVVAVFCITAIIFSATTYDSASYILASTATKALQAGEDPALWQRLFWAVMLGVLPLTLLFIGGFKVVQTAALLASVPLLVVGIIMARSLLLELRAH